jgi:hypothetical protein
MTRPVAKIKASDPARVLLEKLTPAEVRLLSLGACGYPRPSARSW